MDGLDPIDRDNLGPTLAPHWDLVAQVHRARTRMFGLGGAGVIAAAVAAPLVVAWRWEPSAFQIALTVLGAGLTGLAVVRTLARGQADRLRRRVQDHCDAHGVDVADLVAAARKLPSRLYFFAALWDAREVDKK